MKFTCTIEINAPLEQVAALWFDEDHFKDWQDGFVSIEWIEGQKDKQGSKSRILLNKGKMELIETVLEYQYPYRKKGLYQHKHLSNTQETTFEKLENGNTLYCSVVDYFEFHHFMPKLMFKLFPGLFKKMSMKWMMQFKKLVESKV